MTAANEKIPPAFTIQIDHPRNSDVVITSIPGVKLRSTIKSSRTVVQYLPDGTRIEQVPVDQAAFLGRFPTIPGQMLEVNPQKGTWKITDPLYKNDELKAALKRALRDSHISAGDVEGVPPTEGRLDPDRLKTLVRECVWIVTNEHGKCKKGVMPDQPQVDGMPGRYLANPRNSSFVPGAPRYEDEMPEYATRVNSM